VSHYQFPGGAGQAPGPGQPAKRPVPIVVAVLVLVLLLCAAAAIFYVVLFDPFGLSFGASGRCQGMAGHQQELCEHFAATHESQVPGIPPDRAPLPRIAAPER
jgi:hypothetical protein